MSADYQSMEMLISVRHIVEDAVKEAVRLAVRNALTEATAGLEKRIVDKLAMPHIQTQAGADGSRSVLVTFKVAVDG